jgi:hypothetical protein
MQVGVEGVLVAKCGGGLGSGSVNKRKITLGWP